MSESLSPSMVTRSCCALIVTSPDRLTPLISNRDLVDLALNNNPVPASRLTFGTHIKFSPDPDDRGQEHEYVPEPQKESQDEMIETENPTHEEIEVA